MSAAAEMTISPIRTIISASNPKATIEVSNPSDRIIEIRIDWLDLWATKEGYRPASSNEREQLSAAPYLVLSPPSLRLEPGKRGTVTIMLRGDLPPSAKERRSHVLFSSNAVRTQLRKTSGLEVDAQLQISTPVLIRTRQEPPRVKIGNTKLVRDEKGMLELDITLSTKGKNSAIGKLSVTRSDSKVIEIDNLAIYADEGKRRVRIPLGTHELANSEIRVSFAGVKEQEGSVSASKKFVVAPRN